MSVAEEWFKSHLILSAVLFVQLVIAISVKTGLGELPAGQYVLAVSLVLVLPARVLGITSTEKYRNYRTVLLLFVPTAIFHCMCFVVMIVEWASEDCSEHVFALCADGESNFLLVMFIDLGVHAFFLYDYKNMWCWKNELIDEKRMVPVFEIGVETDTDFSSRTDTEPDTLITKF